MSSRTNWRKGEKAGFHMMTLFKACSRRSRTWKQKSRPFSKGFPQQNPLKKHQHKTKQSTKSLPPHRPHWWTIPPAHTIHGGTTLSYVAKIMTRRGSFTKSLTLSVPCVGNETKTSLPPKPSLTQKRLNVFAGMNMQANISVWRIPQGQYPLLTTWKPVLHALTD